MGGGGNTTTLQKSDPWLQQQPYLLDIFKQAQAQYNNGPAQYFGSTPLPAMPVAPVRESFMQGQAPGTGVRPPVLGGPLNTNQVFDEAGFNAAQAKYQTDLEAYNAAKAARANEPIKTLAPISPETLQAQEMARGSVPGVQNIANDAAFASNYGLTKAIDPANNPFFQSAVSSTIRPMIQAFTDTGGVLSSIRSDFGDAGQYGGTRMGLGEGIAAGRLADATGNVAAQMGNQAYSEGLNAQSRALALAPQTQQMQLAGSNILQSLGDQTRMQQQDFINEAIKRWNYEQTAPAQSLAQYQNMIQGNFGGMSTGSMQGPTQSPILGGVGGAALGYGAASSGILGPAFAANPLIGAGLGAIMMLLASSN
jgi:hypothetical protein